MDFPTAWAKAEAVSPEQHDPRCSFAKTNGAVLCDCWVIRADPNPPPDIRCPTCNRSFHVRGDCADPWHRADPDPSPERPEPDDVDPWEALKVLMAENDTLRAQVTTLTAERDALEVRVGAAEVVAEQAIAERDYFQRALKEEAKLRVAADAERDRLAEGRKLVGAVVNEVASGGAAAGQPLADLFAWYVSALDAEPRDPGDG